MMSGPKGPGAASHPAPTARRLSAYNSFALLSVTGLVGKALPE
jgi:hypothetical protein